MSPSPAASTAGTGGTTVAPDCTTGFIPAATNLDTVAGVWLGYDSPYLWPTGNIQGQPAGSREDVGAGRVGGPLRLPDAEPHDVPGRPRDPGCSRFGMTDSFVPFQPNLNPDGTANPIAGQDDAILYGATIAGSGRPAARHDQEYLTFDAVLQRSRLSRSRRRCTLRAGGGNALAAGTAGADASRRAGPSTPRQARRRRSPTSAATTVELHGHAERPARP